MSGEQFPNGHPERHCETLDVVDRDIPDLALNVCDERAMQPRLEGKVFLRPRLGSAQRTDVGGQNRTSAGRCFSQVSSGVMESRRIFTGLTRLSQPRISHNHAL